ncbi:sensor histidine kinase [Streptomyces sp. Je 1-369]|uniref:sensor histidine kinase n=1 Tax=Streptomyces sp. Je 1-369 TaxID=2966192 RepID=UPI002286965C|nr:histidine kinase [Streptomyces sp. Je 1-369]WAL99200.1 histidine kinase [Streptomyces sp. Je 1-369]
MLLKRLSDWGADHPSWSTAQKCAVAAFLLSLTVLDDVLLERLPPLQNAFAVGSAVVAGLCAVPLESVSRTIRAGIAVVASWTTTLFLLAGDDAAGAWGVGELVALLLLLVGTVWRGSDHAAAILGPPLAVACIAIPARDSDPHEWTLAITLITVIVAAFSLLLRTQSEQRVRDLDALRAAERRELARELHDVVAHHVTGIVVQTKAARFAAQDPEEGARVPQETSAMLERIEREATEALGAMRRLVAVMRRADPGRPVTTAPVASLADTRKLVADFAGGDCPDISLFIEPGIEDLLPPDVTAGVHRIVREALTNVRKHAADARHVRITLTTVDSDLELKIVDDGRTAAALPERARGGGFGIEGMRERAAAMGGSLRTGPLPGGGWQNVAVLPLRPATTPRPVL